LKAKQQRQPNIIQAILNPKLFGSLPAFKKDIDTWRAWIVWLKAVFALPMDIQELEIFRKCTDRTNPPKVEPSEIDTIAPRRSGKSFIMGVVAVFVAYFRSFAKYLNTGERAVVLIQSRDRAQSEVVFNYIWGIISAIGPLRAKVVAKRADEIELNNGVVIAVKTSDYRAVRGVTIVCCICDEAAFWDSQGVNPDREILAAIRPAMATIPNAKLLIISTPYAKTGALYEAYREFYGVDNDDVLIWKAPTRTMNPTIPEKIIQRELERDPEAGRSEWLGEFREDIEAAFPLDAILECVIPGRVELVPSSEHAHKDFGDFSGNRSDPHVQCIGHAVGDKVVIDCLKVWTPPVDLDSMMAEAATLLKTYGISRVQGDNYAGDWPVQVFRKYGIEYEVCKKPKSELYLSLIPAICSKKVELLDNKKLIDELRHLERRRGRSGKDRIDHPPRLHDDMANTVAGLVHMFSVPAIDTSGIIMVGERLKPDWGGDTGDKFLDNIDFDLTRRSN